MAGEVAEIALMTDSLRLNEDAVGAADQSLRDFIERAASGDATAGRSHSPQR